MPKTKTKAEFGDFQTPLPLALEICRAIRKRIGDPQAVLEPTCGQGTFVSAALDVFAGARQIRGYDINPLHLQDASRRVAAHRHAQRVCLEQADFFQADWAAVLRGLGSPVLILGNPPWVTNAELGALGGANLPRKSNLHGLVGLDALLGKSNFDISEWMLLRLLQSLGEREGTLAMLVKTAVARKVLSHLWGRSHRIHRAALFSIDAAHHFDAAVDACLFTVSSGAARAETRCEVFADLSAERPEAVLGFADGRLLADLAAYERGRHLVADAPVGWRSGVKHDCARVFELRRAGRLYENGFGERVALEEEVVYPLLKSSHVAHNRLDSGRYVLLPQRRMGQDTTGLSTRAPEAWSYLNRHADRLAARKSSIYRNRPRFSIFGIGDYSFAPWKVAISGLYKSFRFTVVPPRDAKPVLLDDTVYFLPCATQREAEHTAALLNGEQATDFFSAYLFPDAKRPVTSRLLNRLDPDKLDAL